MGECFVARVGCNWHDRGRHSVDCGNANHRNDDCLHCLHGIGIRDVYLFNAITLVRPSPLLIQLRAWDQAVIYTMIAGTYTPLIYQFADDSVRLWLLGAVWIAAGYGFLGKVALKHRVNSISTVTYLALGWLPVIPLIGRVPRTVVMWMFIGGVLYTVGVAFLVNDRKVRYMHVVWHLFVIMAALAHYWTIYKHTVSL